LFVQCNLVVQLLHIVITYRLTNKFVSFAPSFYSRRQ